MAYLKQTLKYDDASNVFFAGNRGSPPKQPTSIDVENFAGNK